MATNKWSLVNSRGVVMQAVALQRSIAIDDLAASLNKSPSVVRRTVRQLERQGYLSLSTPGPVQIAIPSKGYPGPQQEGPGEALHDMVAVLVLAARSRKGDSK